MPVVLLFIYYPLFEAGLVLLSLFVSIILVDATVRTRNLFVGALSVVASFIQLIAYGIGFLSEGIKKLFE